MNTQRESPKGAAEMARTNACFLSSLRDSIGFNDLDPPLKRRAIVGRPSGTFISFLPRFGFRGRSGNKGHRPAGQFARPRCWRGSRKGEVRGGGKGIIRRG